MLDKIDYIKEQTATYKSIFRGAKDMHVVLDGTSNCDEITTAYANTNNGTVHIYLKNFDINMDLKRILIHEDLGHLLTQNVYHTQKEWSSLAYMLVNSDVFKEKRDYIHQYYQENTSEMAKLAEESNLSADSFTDYIYVSEFVSIWFEDNINKEPIKYSNYKFKRFFNEMLFRDPLLNLNHLLYQYRYSQLKRPSSWKKDGFTILT